MISRQVTSRFQRAVSSARMSTMTAPAENGSRPERAPLFSQEHEALRQTTRKLIDSEINPYVDEWEKNKIFPAKELFPKLGKAGLLGISKPTKYGGSGLDFSYSVAFAEELANINAQAIGMAIGVQTDMATPALMRFGSDKLCKEFLVPAITGEAVACIGVSEPGAGSDVAAIRSHAKKSGDDYIINGSKMWITNSCQADWMCMLVNTGSADKPSHRNKSLIMVPMKTKGVTVNRRIDKIGNHSSDTGEIFFDDVRVPQWHLIGEENMGFMYQMMQFEQERLFAAATTPAVLDRVIKITIDYCRERTTFGQPLINNQYIHFRLAELQTEIECLRALNYRCLDKILQGDNCTELVSMAKVSIEKM